MVGTAEEAKNIFRLVEQIQIEEIQNQSQRYFGWLGIGNDGLNNLPIPLRVSYLTQLSDGTGT